MRYSSLGLGRGALDLWGAKELLGVCGWGEMGLILEVARGGLVVGRGDVMGPEGRCGAVGRAVVPVQVGVHGRESKWANSQAVFISVRFHFPELQHRVQQNKPKSVIHSLSAKLAIPSNPHLPIIALSCMLKSVQSSLACAHSYLVPSGAFTDGSAAFHPRKRGGWGNQLTGSGEHLFAGEHCVCPCHKAHHLFGLAQRLASSGKPDDRPGEDDPGSRNRSEHSRERYRLSNPVSIASESRKQQ